MPFARFTFAPIAILLLVFCNSAFAKKLEFPRLTGRVVDNAGLISQPTEQTLKQILTRAC